MRKDAYRALAAMLRQRGSVMHKAWMDEVAK